LRPTGCRNPQSPARYGSPADCVRLRRYPLHRNSSPDPPIAAFYSPAAGRGLQLLRGRDK
jgi:hypothetical protein